MHCSSKISKWDKPHKRIKSLSTRYYIYYYLSNFYRYRKYILIFESSYYRFLLFHIIEKKKKRERIYYYTEKKREKNLPLTLEEEKKKRRRKSFSSIKVFPLLPFSSSFFSPFPSLKLSYIYTLAKIRCCWLAGENFPFPKHESHALFPPFVLFSGKIHQHHFSTEALNWPV